ncbi:Beta propeller domain-containing protein [Geosporobacter subterraneus DSM 17957]|uniref:Beta propeller domain-containing protein n=1 Tax=Geosporobacter subterraneus DSM 17957 TaxID=1121919 RepID=A0A1M6GG28_9FIRM|nr:Beta propeller domain-containing protein [Geosporobacter subterraneus DSM 17957]
MPGQILNQFSMDEDEKHFRIATTTGEMWRSDEFTSKNNVYILDEQIKRVGKLEGFAPGERIYAMGFVGAKGYMVTFRETDPFFVLDLKEPKEPKMLGYLKIPGYSDYLHPYDENHIIGFGKEVMEVKGAALQAGMKIAVFDVPDVSKSVEKFKLLI